MLPRPLTTGNQIAEAMARAILSADGETEVQYLQSCFSYLGCRGNGAIKYQQRQINAGQGIAEPRSLCTSGCFHPGSSSVKPSRSLLFEQPFLQVESSRARSEWAKEHPWGLELLCQGADKSGTSL